MTEAVIVTTDDVPISEKTRLLELEAIVADGLDTFVRVGEALAEIRDSRLYRETHKTFEDYCRDRWQMGRAYANRSIQAAEITSVLAPIGAKPTNEAQARELARLKDKPEEMKEVWAGVTATHEKPTAAHVREAVERHEAQSIRPEEQPGPTEEVLRNDVTQYGSNVIDLRPAGAGRPTAKPTAYRGKRAENELKRLWKIPIVGRIADQILEHWDDDRIRLAAEAAAEDELREITTAFTASIRCLRELRKRVIAVAEELST